MCVCVCVNRYMCVCLCAPVHILIICLGKTIEDESRLVIVPKLVMRQKVRIIKVVTDWEVVSVKTAEIVTSVMIVAVVTDHRAESLVVMLVVTRETVEVRIDMEIKIDTTVVAIDEIIGIMIIELKTVLAAPREDHVVLHESGWKENETIDTKDLDHPREIAEIGISSKPGTISEIAKEIETNVVDEWMMRKIVTTRVIGRNFFLCNLL